MRIFIITIVMFLFLVTAFISLRNALDFFQHLDIKANLDVGDINVFHNYLAKFNKNYERREYLKRLNNFKKSEEEITRLNSLHRSVVFGHTKFSDWSEDEFERTMLSPPYRGCHEMKSDTCPPSPTSENRVNRSYTISDVPGDNYIPLSFDWRSKHVVGEVLEQKFCRGCWAFSIVGVMESMAAISGKGFEELSIQELIDCGINTGGCSGGYPSKALEFLCKNNYPIISASQYPLKLVDEQCLMPNWIVISDRRIKKFVNLCDVDEKVILKLIAKHGPVVAVVNATPWKNYIGGVIYTACEGEWQYLNHVVQIVGYNLSAPVPYYWVRNSWGKDYGVDGYVRLAIGRNVCGLKASVAYFDVK